MNKFEYITLYQNAGGHKNTITKKEKIKNKKSMKVYEKKIKMLEYHDTRLYGLNNIDDDILNDQSEFVIGSITKVFTIVTLLILQQNGKIDVNDNIGKYINNDELKATKIIDIINHVSGLKNIDDNHDYEKGSNIYYNSAMDVYDSFKKEILLKNTKGIKNYSNIGFIILGAMIESITRDSYKNTVNKLIIKPLGLKNTGFDDTNIILYTHNGEKLLQCEKYERSFASSAGQLKSSIKDLIKFANFPKKLLNKRSRNLLHNLYICKKIDDEYIIKHNGGIFGGSSSLTIEYDVKWNIKKINIKFETAV